MCCTRIVLSARVISPFLSSMCFLWLLIRCVLLWFNITSFYRSVVSCPKWPVEAALSSQTVLVLIKFLGSVRFSYVPRSTCLNRSFFVEKRRDTSVECVVFLP